MKKYIALGLMLTLSIVALAQTYVSESGNWWVENNQDGKGYTIYSRSLSSSPEGEVIGYSDEGTFDANNIPDGLRFYLECYDKKSLSTTISPKGDGETARIIHKATGTTAITPFATSQWSQGSPYNDQCPIYKDNNHGLTGCVATSVAQILYYVKNPDPQGVNIPSYVTDSYKIYVGGIKGERTYNWDKMSDTYPSTTVANNAVAKLMFHVGAALKMDYGEVSSSASDGIPNMLINYFGIDPSTVKYINCNDYTQDEWQAMIDTELEARRAVYVSGVASGGGGHAFFCCGRDTKGYYYMNWGWGAGGTYVALDALGGFSTDVSLVTGIQRVEGTAENAALKRLGYKISCIRSWMEKYVSGTNPGMCEKSAMDAMTAALDAAQKRVDAGESGMSSLGVDSINNRLTSQYSDLANHVIPIADGYYYIKNTKQNFTFDMGLANFDHQIMWKNLYSYTGDARMLWKLKYDNETAAYSFINAAYDEGVSTVQKNTAVYAAQPAGTWDNMMSITPAGYTGETSSAEFYYTLRPYGSEDENGYMNLNGNAVEGAIIGWTNYSGITSTSATWKFQQVSDSEAKSIIASTSVQKRENKLVPYNLLVKGDSAGTYDQYKVALYQAAVLEGDATKTADAKATAIAAYYPYKDYKYYIISPLSFSDGKQRALRMKCDGQTLCWEELKRGESQFIWKVENADDNANLNLYRLTNCSCMQSITGKIVGGGAKATITTSDTSDNVLYLSGYNNGESESGEITAQEPVAIHPAQYWKLEGVEDEYSDLTPIEKQMKNKIAEADSICNANLTSVLKTSPKKLTSTPKMYSSPYTDPDGDAIMYLQNTSTVYMWNSLKADLVPTALHYVQIEGDSIQKYNGPLQLYIKRNSTDTDHQITRVGILASADSLTWTNLGEVETPYAKTGEVVKANFFNIAYNSDVNYKYLRLFFNATTGGQGWWQGGKLHLYRPGTAQQSNATKLIALYKALNTAKAIDSPTESDIKTLKDAIDAFLSPTGIDQLEDERVNVSDCKYIKNGQLVIRKNGIEYNVIGTKL